MALRGRAASPWTELVLIVDDDRETRQLYTESLTGYGLRVEVASDPAEALSKSLSGPSVICCRISSDSSDPFEFCRLVRQSRQTSHIPLIVVVDGRNPGDAALAREAGADSVLAAPCQPECLGAEIRRVLSRARDVRRLSRQTPPSTVRLDALRARVSQRFRKFLKARLR